MKTALSLGQIFGVRTRLHYTWLIAFVLTIAVVITQFSEAFYLWQRVIFGVVTYLLFLISVNMREFFVSFLAILNGIPVKRVNLFIFGGVPQITQESTRPSRELLLALVGLLANIIVAGIIYGVHIILVMAGDIIIAGITQWLAYIYLLLALFHFLPGFPLDGGRILRALLWKLTNNYGRATRIASWVGWFIGLFCILGGIQLLIVGQQWFTGLVLALVGWVLQSATTQSRRQAVMHEALQSFRAGDVINRECPLITEQLSLEQLIRDCLLVTAQRFFVVVDGARLQGAVTMRSIKKVPRARWGSTRIGEIMTPADGIRTAQAQQSAANLLKQMDDFGLEYMPVLEEDAVIGVATRDNLIRLGRILAELRK